MDPADLEAYDRAVAALEARGPGRMLPDLDRIRRLSELLGDPQLAYPSVHVTGTNGKGSVVRMVTALCAAAGLSAGSYTSPHLQSVRERLSLAGRPISPARFAALHAEVDDLARLVDAEVAAAHPEDHVTYFELLTAMAAWWFADLPVDVGVFEVGMGGRWDATNLVRGDVAVLNEVDLDHRQLGSTPAEVATEKAGIIKPGSHVVSATQRPDVAAVIDAAVAAVDARCWRLGEDLEVMSRQVAVGGQLLALRVGDRIVDDILLPLFGAHQARNAALALGAFAALTGGSFEAMDDDVVRHGLGAVLVPGRLEVVHRDPTVVLDGAHNPHGAQAAAAALSEAFRFDTLTLVVGCLDDKDIAGILAALRPVAGHVVVTEAPSPRAASLEWMRAAAEAAWAGTGVVVEAAADLDEALAVATSVTGPGDGILVCGSLRLVGAVRDRYLPLPVDDDEVVRQPEDLDDERWEQAREALEAAATVRDREAFAAALGAVLDDEPEDDTEVAEELDIDVDPAGEPDADRDDG